MDKERLDSFLSEATCEAFDDWDNHIQSMTLSEALTALRGLQEYSEHFLDEEVVDLGWHHVVDDL